MIPAGLKSVVVYAVFPLSKNDHHEIYNQLLYSLNHSISLYQNGILRLNTFTKITHSIIESIKATITLKSITKILSPNIIILTISTIPIIPITAPTMNSSIITKMIPMKNNKIEIKLTSPLIKTLEIE